METFKKYINEWKIDSNPISYVKDSYSLSFVLPSDIKLIFNNLKNNKELTKDDINILTQKYHKNNYFRVVIEYLILINKKIPEELVDHLGKNKISIGLFVQNIRTNPVFNKKIPKIIKRNPELLEFFA